MHLKNKNESSHRGKRSYETGFDGVQRVEPWTKVVRGIRKAPSRRVEADNVPYAYEKLHKRENGRRRSSESNSKDSRICKVKERYNALTFGNRAFEPVTSDWKRKRVYAEQNTSVERKFQNNLEAPSGTDLSKARKKKLKDNVVKDKRSTKKVSDDSEQASWKNTPVARRNSNKNEIVNGKGNTNLGATRKDIDKAKFCAKGYYGNGMIDKSGKSTSDSSKLFYQNQKNYAVDHSTSKKKIQDQKNMAADSVVRGDRPKKKRVMRIDPHDLSNKRLDHGTRTTDVANERKEDSATNENAEMSKNAQFRSIQPSPSIVSFVEENLLGRRREIELRKAGYNTELSVPLDNIPFSTTMERERIEEPVFRNKLTFFAAAKFSSSFPSPDLPEIAVAGRSNVGKSSLLNALTRQWGVVRTSDKPGLTQTINFFKLGSKQCLVDLPGYGFAYAKEEAKDVWEELVKEYVSTRVGLKRVCLLIDTKWGMKPRDLELVDLMERSKTKFQIVLTKTDLVFPIDVARRAMQIEESLKAKKLAVQPVMMVSSKSGAGIRSLRTVLAGIARFAKL